MFQPLPWDNCQWPYIPGETPGTGQLPLNGREREAAEKAVDQLGLTAPAIGSAPCTEDGCMGAVGVPVWLWIESPWVEKRAQAQVTGGSIQAVARPQKVIWDMGDGTTIECQQGTPYSESYGWAESPDCGHIYQQTSADQPNQRYTLSADLVYEVTITGNVQTQFEMATRSVVYPAIGEYQSVVTDR